MQHYRDTLAKRTHLSPDQQIRQLFMYEDYNAHTVLACITELKASGYPVQTPSESMAHFIVKCAEHGYLKVLQQLLEWEVPLTQSDRHGTHALSAASLHQHLAMLDFLIQQAHFPVNLQTANQSTALHSAIQYHQPDPEIIFYLLENGANPNARNQSGSTPLHTAAYKRKALIADLLLRYGANPHAADDAGHTPCTIAAAASSSATWFAHLFEKKTRLLATREALPHPN